MEYLIPLLIALIVFPIALYRKQIAEYAGPLTLTVLYTVLSVFFLFFGFFNPDKLFVSLFLVFIAMAGAAKFYKVHQDSQSLKGFKN